MEYVFRLSLQMLADNLDEQVPLDVYATPSAPEMDKIILNE